MSFPVGIGIVTYNRRDILADTIDKVRGLTRHPDAVMVVADDGSTDGTLRMLRDRQVPVITGVNKGIAWNKNRALFLLSQMLHCQTVILLEDDTQPAEAGWESEWMEAAHKWGHVNFIRDLMIDNAESGSGTPADPYRSRQVTAQCSAYSSNALTYGGYYDPMFQGFGHEHVEHSYRLLHFGYGGTESWPNGENLVHFYLIKGRMKEVASVSHNNAEQVAANLIIAQQLMARPEYRAPWRDDAQLRQFRSETDSAISAGPDHFRLTPRPSARARRGLLSRLLGRR